MKSLRRQFIEDNRDKFQSYLGKVSDKRRPVSGLGVLTPSESLEAILEDMDDSYLPLSFVYLFWEFDNLADRTFVLHSLKTLSEFNENGVIIDTTMAYVYAYSLWKNDASNQSHDVLQKLADQCFPPALATMGDACIANQNIEAGLSWYANAMDNGHMIITPRHNKIVMKDAPFLKNIPLRILLFFDIFYRAVKFMRKGMQGEHALYLDFYGIKHHLNKYWETPKVERMQRIAEYSE